MQLVSGLLLIDRSRFFEFDLAGERAPSRYRGFDGLLWPDWVPPFLLPGGVAPWQELEKVVSYRKSREDAAVLDIIGVCQLDASTPFFDAGRSPSGEFELLGYDVGYLFDEDSHFSIVIQEVIPGLHQSLAALRAELNDSLLFREYQDAVQCLDIRSFLDSGDEPLETLQEFAEISVYAVYGLKSCG